MSDSAVVEAFEAAADDLIARAALVEDQDGTSGATQRWRLVDSALSRGAWCQDMTFLSVPDHVHAADHTKFSVALGLLWGAGQSRVEQMHLT